MKTCRKCGKDKDFSEFGKQAKAKDGLKNYCKLCIQLINQKRYEDNKSKHIAQVKKWQAANQDKVLEYKKKHRDKKKNEQN